MQAAVLSLSLDATIGEMKSLAVGTQMTVGVWTVAGPRTLWLSTDKCWGLHQPAICQL